MADLPLNRLQEARRGCLVCGASMEGRRSDAKYCSISCKDKAYVARHPENASRVRQLNRESYQRNKAQYLARNRAYQSAHPDMQPESNRRYYRKFKDYVFGLLGGCCCKCGFTDRRALQVNHINGDGKKDPTGRDLYKLIYFGQRSTEDLDLRCANCNVIYEYERGRVRE